MNKHKGFYQINAIDRYRYGTHARNLNKESIKNIIDLVKNESHNPDLNNTNNNDNHSHLVIFPPPKEIESLDSLITKLDLQFQKMKKSSKKDTIKLLLENNQGKHPISYYFYSTLFKPKYNRIKSDITFYEQNKIDEFNDLEEEEEGKGKGKEFLMGCKEAKYEDNNRINKEEYMKCMYTLTKMKDLLNNMILPIYISQIDWTGNQGLLSYMISSGSNKILRILLEKELMIIIKLELVGFNGGEMTVFKEIDNSNFTNNKEIQKMLNEVINDILNNGVKKH